MPCANAAAVRASIATHGVTMRRTAPAEMPEGLVALMRDPAKRESLIARAALTCTPVSKTPSSP